MLFCRGSLSALRQDLPRGNEGREQKAAEKAKEEQIGLKRSCHLCRVVPLVVVYRPDDDIHADRGYRAPYNKPSQNALENHFRRDLRGGVFRRPVYIQHSHSAHNVFAFR